MFQGFTGEHRQKVDGKARVLVPLAFRRQLEEGDPGRNEPRCRAVLVYGDDRRRFVECYPIAGYDTLKSRIRGLPAGSLQRRALERQLISRAATVELDEDGRLVLPPQVRDKLGLDPDRIKAGPDLVLAGTLDTFQIWTLPEYEADLAAQEEELARLDALAGGADILSLLPPVQG